MAAQKRIDKKAHGVAFFTNKYEMSQGCSKPKVLIYRERTRIVQSEELLGKVQYKINIHDMLMANYTCVRLEISGPNVTSNKRHSLWYRLSMLDEFEGIEATGAETPSELLRYYLMPQKYNPREDEEAELRFPYKWKGKYKHLKPVFIEEPAEDMNLKDFNLNILIGFSFVGEGIMKLLVFGVPKLRRIRPTTTLRTTTSKRPKSWTTELPEYWRQGFSVKDPFNSKRKKKMNRLEKAQERNADREKIERRNEERNRSFIDGFRKDVANTNDNEKNNIFHRARSGRLKQDLDAQSRIFKL